jgi:hypothetical protein
MNIVKLRGAKEFLGQHTAKVSNTKEKQDAILIQRKVEEIKNSEKQYKIV